ncbi:hypothetical protein K488DRAFT_82562 [Vararia minispora EC-137]|uniref:Uncharacterized protein n=1 Tax=Vararia minispora EC-137 TaxID=1314806 RepID=A0ACB8QVX2_9AGAM|nr:hypothetical protein K488DRAFT_82562 [Vararia minispora EC-137]
MPAADFYPSKDAALPAGLAAAPPPWHLKATLWTFLYSNAPSTSTADVTKNVNNTLEVLQGAPPGSYHPCEVPHSSALAPVGDKFQLQGGPRGIILVRYEDTPVGPYDELIMLPGLYARPGKARGKAQRITNIYVSTDESVVNGRRNWYIPKHRADFVFKPIDARRTEVTVSHPPDSPLHTGTPFFRAILTRSRVPLLPLPAFSMPALVQPPLSAPRYEEGIMPAVISSENTHPWLSVAPTYKGRWGLAWIGKVEGAETYGDGVGFPTLEGLWSLGCVFEGLIDFPASKVVE